MYKRMPWGKYKGKLFTQIPCDYLDWVATEAKATTESLRQSILDYLHQEEDDTDEDAVFIEELKAELSQAKKRVAQLERELDHVAELQKRSTPHKDYMAWYRRMSLLCHPDRGGTHELMVLLNEFKEMMK